MLAIENRYIRSLEFNSNTTQANLNLLQEQKNLETFTNDQYNSRENASFWGDFFSFAGAGAAIGATLGVAIGGTIAYFTAGTGIGAIAAGGALGAKWGAAIGAAIGGTAAGVKAYNAQDETEEGELLKIQKYQDDNTRDKFSAVELAAKKAIKDEVANTTRTIEQLKARGKLRNLTNIEQQNTLQGKRDIIKNAQKEATTVRFADEAEFRDKIELVRSSYFNEVAKIQSSDVILDAYKVSALNTYDTGTKLLKDQTEKQAAKFGLTSKSNKVKQSSSDNINLGIALSLTNLSAVQDNMSQAFNAYQKISQSLLSSNTQIAQQESNLNYSARKSELGFARGISSTTNNFKSVVAKFERFQSNSIIQSSLIQEKQLLLSQRLQILNEEDRLQLKAISESRDRNLQNIVDRARLNNQGIARDTNINKAKQKYDLIRGTEVKVDQAYSKTISGLQNATSAVTTITGAIPSGSGGGYRLSIGDEGSINSQAINSDGYPTGTKQVFDATEDQINSLQELGGVKDYFQ